MSPLILGNDGLLPSPKMGMMIRPSNITAILFLLLIDLTPVQFNQGHLKHFPDKWRHYALPEISQAEYSGPCGDHE